MFRVTYKNRPLQFITLSYDRDIFSMLDVLQFTLVNAPENFFLDSRNEKVRLYFKDKFLGVFAITKYDIDNSQDNFSIKVFCRNANLSDMLDSNLDSFQEKTFSKATIGGIVNQIGADFGVRQSSDPISRRNGTRTINSISIKTTEKIGAFLGRLSSHTGLFISSDNFGNVIFVDPKDFSNATQNFKINQDRLINWSMTRDFSQSFRKYVLFNDSGGLTASQEKTDSPLAEVQDDSFRADRKRVLYIQQADITTEEQAQVLLSWRHAFAKAQETNFRLTTPGDNDLVYKIGFIHRIEIPPLIQTNLVLNAISYSADQSSFIQNLSFVDQSAFVLQPRKSSSGGGESLFN